MELYNTYESPAVQFICIGEDVITTSYADSLPFLPTVGEDTTLESEL